MTGSTLPRKIRRLAAMDAAELGYRVRERVRLETERAVVHLRGLCSGNPGAAREEELLRRLPPAVGGRFLETLRAAADRFYLPAGTRRRRQLAELACRVAPGLRTGAAEEADALVAHRFELLGFGEAAPGETIDWHRDPLTGAPWERRFWADYDLVGAPAARDPKRVHELARHQHLPRLGKAYFLTGEECYAREAVTQMLCWVDQNPVGVGVHWHSSLEIALRSISWLWTLFFVLPSPALDEAAARRLGASLFAQLDHVLRYPSVYSSPNTHLVGEAAALFLGGLVFAGCDGADVWYRRGAGLLADALDRQVLPDGVHSELSAAYHAYALDFYLQALALARRVGTDVPDRLRHRIESMVEPLVHLLHPDGSLPRLGDDDGGRALALSETSYARPLDLLATAALLFERGDFKARAGSLHEEAVWLLGSLFATDPGPARDLRDGRKGPHRASERDLTAAWEAIPAREPAALRASFPDAGYWTQRSGWRPDDDHLVFDCGGLGRPSGGHGHADALSVTLVVGGREMLVDPGTYLYNGRPGWRRAFRGTGAHNTVVVDGADQSEPDGTFSWRRRARARLLEDGSFGALDLVAGEHDGYARPGLGVIHRRRLLQVRPDYWLVLDDFRAAGGARSDHGPSDGAVHTFEVLYHLAPEARLAPIETTHQGATACTEARSGSAGLQLFVYASASMKVAVLVGDPEHETPELDAGDRPVRPLAWVSERYGAKAPAPTVSARFRSPLPAAVVTVLSPFRAAAARPEPRWRPRVLRLRTADGPVCALALAIDPPDGRPGDLDLAVLSPEAPELEVAPWPHTCRMRGEAFLARLDADVNGLGGRLRRLLAVRATHLVADGEPILRSRSPVTFHHRAAAERPRVALGGGRSSEVEPCAE